MNYVKEALRLIELGISIVPLKENEKKPSILWKELQERLLTPKEIERYCKECGGLAAITGSISRLLCIDFDLNKELSTQDYFSLYMEKIPEKLKKKLLINTTRSGGYHLWLRTDYEDKSRKLTRRYLTIPELSVRYEEALKHGAEPYNASQALLNKPLECIIETRSRGSYGVLVHESYNRFWGNKLNEFSEEEVDLLINRCYEIDCEFVPLKKFSGERDDYRLIREFNEDTSAEEIIDWICNTGVYQYVGKDHNGNAKMKRVGSSNPYSARVFYDTGIFSTFSQDTLFKGDKSNYSPFDVYCAVNNFSQEEAIINILETRKNLESE